MCKGYGYGGIFVVSLEQLLKFLLNSLISLLTSPRDGQSQLRIEKLIRTLLLGGVCVCVGGGGGGDHLYFAIPQERSEKFYSYSWGGGGDITKNLQNLKNFKGPPPGKK